MNLYTIALFIHMLGLISLFGAFVLLQNSGRRLRNATTWQDARPWLELLRPINGMLIGGPVMLLASGLYMAQTQWSFTMPWVSVSIAGAVLTMILGPLAVGRKLGQIRHAAGDDLGVIPPEGRAMLSAPGLWSPIFAMNGAALGILWLMTTKPGWGQSIGIPLALAVLGSLIGMAMNRSRVESRKEKHWEHPMAQPPPLARRHRAG